MKNNEIIDIVDCPYCDNPIIDSNLVCENCVPYATIDMSIHDIQNAISMLKSNNQHLTKDRKKNIQILLKELDSFLTQ